MKKFTFKEFKALPTDHQALLIGHFLTVIGGTFIAFGKLLSTLNRGELPNEQMNNGATSSERDIPDLFETNENSYFNS